MALFEARDLHLRFGDRVVLENVSLAFEAGRLSGIMGPNGAGKTTCFNVLTGRYKPDRGRVLLDGRDITGRSPQEIARLGVARSFQLMSLFDEFTVFENVAIALPATRARGHDPIGQAYADPALVEEAYDILDNVGLADRADDPAKSLPYGARRALEIGVALACRPKLLFLDEPTAGPRQRRPRAPRRSGAQAEGHPHHRHHRARHGVPVLARRRDLGHPLGPGDRARHAGRAQGQSLGRGFQPGAAQLMLDVAAIDTFYGETQALFGVSLSVRTGEVRGAARRQRRRQDHGAALDPRPDARAPRRHPLPGQVHHRPPHARDRPRRHRLGARRPPPVPDADGRQEPQPRREAHRLPPLVDGRGDRHLHAAQIPDGARGRDAVGRRDADGGHRPRAAGRAGPHAVRRAEPGPRAQDRGRRAGRDPPPQGRRASPPSSWSRTPTSRSASPTASWCSSHGQVAWAGEAATLTADPGLKRRLLGGLA